MNPDPSERLHPGTWCAVALLLLTWNALTCSLAGPLTYYADGVQYQLLARNRLHGHYEVGDTTQTVGTEGRHPMWRPGLVWIEEGLASSLGSVQNGAAAASALGTTCLELALLWLVWCCFGKKTWLCLLIALGLPAASSTFFTLAVYQGPEVWAAVCIVAGLAALVVGLQHCSWPWAVIAGMTAGLAGWFRTGNLLLFAVPCAVYSLAALRPYNRVRFTLPAGALAVFVGMTALAGLTTPASVNKTVANLWANAIETNGPFITAELPDGTKTAFSMAGWSLAPGTTETYYDRIVCRSRDTTTLKYVQGHGWEIAATYMGRLKEAVTSCFSGLRSTIGGVIVILFAVQLLLCVAHLDPAPQHTFACAGGALAHYLGPVTLLRGNQPNHYLFLVFPLFLVVAVRGAQRLVELVYALWKRRHSVLARPRGFSWPLSAGAFAAFLALSAPYYRSTLEHLRAQQNEILEDLAALDALGLEGRKVACRNMCWFVDRRVHTVSLPYATVPELETYVRVHGIDGILVRDKEPMPYFHAMPYRSPAEFDQALRQSALFGTPQASGTWRWYPVRGTSLSKRQT